MAKTSIVHGDVDRLYRAYLPAETIVGDHPPAMSGKPSVARYVGAGQEGYEQVVMDGRYPKMKRGTRQVSAHIAIGGSAYPVQWSRGDKAQPIRAMDDQGRKRTMQARIIDTLYVDLLHEIDQDIARLIAARADMIARAWADGKPLQVKHIRHGGQV